MLLSGVIGSFSYAEGKELVPKEHLAPGTSKVIQSIAKEVTGTVIDESGEPLPGVSILEKGTTNGTVTDLDGKFRINVNSDQSVLVFSFIGMATQEVLVGSQSDIGVTLVSDSEALDEVVVVGYGIQKKSDLTGSVGVVSGEDLLREPVGNALQGLKGKVAGVNVFLNSGAPNSSPRVVIRGLGTINSDSSPLYVVDGVVMENISFVNPNDIQSMEVLKDASSTAIYGSRGANGVILITTKRGSKTEGVTIGYDGFVSAGVMARKMDVMNSSELLEVIRTGFENYPKYNDGTPPVFTANDPDLFDANGNPLYNTDWQKEATRTAFSQNHQLSIQSKGEKSSLGAFVNYARMEGVMLESWLNRLNAKIAYDTKPKDWVSLGFNLMVNKTSENSVEEGGGSQVPRRTMLEMPSFFPVKFPDGTWSNSSMISDPYNLEPMANPVHVLKTQERLRDRTQLFGNVFTTFHLMEGLDLRTQFGFDLHDNNYRNYYPTDLMNISSPLGFASIEDQRTSYWQEETYLTYIKELGRHRINAVLGLSWQERTYEGNYMDARGFSDDFFKYNRIQAASQPGAPTSGYNKWSMNSYFLRGSYTYDDKYLVTLTTRVDGSSRFGENNKYGVFPSVGLGWVLSNEDFMESVQSINELKLRSSFGITGNTEIPMYQSLGTVSAGTVLINGSRVSESYVNRLPNPDLGWEKTKQFDAGIDLGILDGKVSFAFDYYYRLTTDLLLDRPVPYSSGFSAVRDNIGSVSNRGIEALVRAFPVSSQDLSWETSLNFNYNKNRIESLGENDEDIFPGPNWVSGSQTILRVGEPLSSFWGYKRLGTWGSDEVDEAAAVGAVPGEAKRSEQRHIIGNGLPDWTGSFTNSLRYKNFDFTLDLQFVYGVDILQQYFHSIEDRSGIANGLRSILYDGWTETNQDTFVQQIRNQSYSGQNSQVDDHWVADGSYLRGNLISLGYTFDNEALERLHLRNLRIYTSVQNAFLISSKDFKGYDPEGSSWGGNQWGQNIFFFQYPKPRTFTMGLSVQF
ncbi:TonB-dependent receptor [Echinicola sediminis]